MTLIEVMVASGIFAVVISLSFGVTIFTTRSFDEKVRVSGMQTKGERALKELMEGITEATAVITEPSDAVESRTGNTTKGSYTFFGGRILFKIPISFGQAANQQAVVNPTGLPVFKQDMSKANLVFPRPMGGMPGTGDFDLVLVFGWRDDRRYVMDMDTNQRVPLQGPGLRCPTYDLPPGMTLNAKGRTGAGGMGYQFVMNERAPLGVDGIFDESVEDIDVDGDGSKYCRFAVGFIEQFYVMDTDGDGNLSEETAVAESRQPMAESNVLMPLYGQDASTMYDASSQTSLDSTLPYALNSANAMRTCNLFFLEPLPAPASQTRRPTKLWINMWMVTLGSDRRPLVAPLKSMVFLRNQS